MMRYYYTPIRTANIKKIIIKILIAGKDSEKLNLSIGGNVNGTATLEIHLVGFLLSLKWNMQFLYKPPITLLGLYLLWTECLCPHRIHMLKSQLPRWWYLEVGLWGWLGHERGSWWMGLAPFLQGPQRVLAPSAGRSWLWTRRGPWWARGCAEPWSWTSSLQNGEKYIPVAYELPRLWYLVTAVKMVLSRCARVPSWQGVDSDG